MAAAVTEDKKINAEFIGRSLTGRGALNFYKGAWFGGILALSQSVGASVGRVCDLNEALAKRLCFPSTARRMAPRTHRLIA